ARRSAAAAGAARTANAHTYRLSAFKSARRARTYPLTSSRSPPDFHIVRCKWRVDSESVRAGKILKRRIMRSRLGKLLLSFVAGGVVALTAVGAQAFPSAQPSPAQARSDVIQVAGGCGPGWHRGPGGACRPNRGVVVAPAPVVVAPRPVVVAPRAVVVAP